MKKNRGLSSMLYGTLLDCNIPESLAKKVASYQNRKLGGYYVKTRDAWMAIVVQAEAAAVKGERLRNLDACHKLLIENRGLRARISQLQYRLDGEMAARPA